MNLDKNFRPWNVKKDDKPKFIPLIKATSINPITPWILDKNFSKYKSLFNK